MSDDAPPPKKAAMYAEVMKKVFWKHYTEGSTEVKFSRESIRAAAASLNVDPKNVGDILYTYRYRRKLPKEITTKAGKGRVWIIRGAGDAQYQMVAVTKEYAYITPRPQGLALTKILDATPGVILKYARDEEQALLAKLRYNRLIDIFTGITCYALQSHLRTKVSEIGQLETDEVYIGVDARGAHYSIPVQAKGGSDNHSIVQIEQDFALCQQEFPDTICRPIAAQFMGDDKIALFVFRLSATGAAEIVQERHYWLVQKDALSDAELVQYRAEAEVSSLRVDGTA